MQWMHDNIFINVTLLQQSLLTIECECIGAIYALNIWTHLILSNLILIATSITFLVNVDY